MPYSDNFFLAAASVGSAEAGQFVLLWMLLGGIGYLLLLPFKRRIGAFNPNTGRWAGPENAFGPAVWVLAAIITGIFMSR